MINNLASNSISIVLNKIDIEEFNPKEVESYDQTLSTIDIDNNEEQLLTDSNQTKITIDDISEIELRNLNSDLQVKPSHWNDDYWEEVIGKYKWFLHKDNYIGCKICFNIKTFMGKKSLLGTMKLFLMDLSYEDLELKLVSHDRSIQHNKSIILLKAQLEKTDINCINIQTVQSSPAVNILRRSRPVDHYCPLCQKGYKIKKALAKHIYNCNNELNSLNFKIPCKCDDERAVSIRSIDEHNVKIHSNNLLFVCKFCFSEFKQTTVLFGHLLLFHDFYWNPYEEFPNIIDKPMIEDNNNKNTGNRPERKKSIANSLSDSIYIMYGAKDNISFAKSKELSIRKPYRKRQFREKPEFEVVPITNSDIRIERVMNESNNEEVSKLTISSSSILTCEYCGGRYVSAGILNAHMANYHSIVPKSDKDAEERRRRKYIKRLNKLVNPLGLNYQINKKTKSTYIRLSSHMRKVRALQMKKKLTMAENPSKISEDMIKKIKQKDIKLLLAKRNKVSASMLTCPTCHVSFENLDLRLEHVSKFHPELEKFSCKICGLIFTNQKTYRQHLEKTHDNSLPKPGRMAPEKTYSCENCHLVFTNQADLSHHLSFSHPEIIEKVNYGNDNFNAVHNCDLDYVEPVKNEIDNELDMLINANGNENVTKCSSCEMSLNNPFELLVHSFTHNENGKQNGEFQSCPNCSKLFFGKHGKIYLKDHYNSEHLKKPLPQCSSCKLTFSSSYVLEKHQVDMVCQNIQIDDPYAPLMSVEKLAFSCSQCGLVFAGQNSKQRFDVHMEKCSFELMNNELLDS